jgi:hypothetical protein
MRDTGARINWQAPRSQDEAYRRHAARSRWNSLRRLRAEDRRQRLLELILEVGGLAWGAQTQLARRLGVHQSTVSRDLKTLLARDPPCPTCGVRWPRRWLEEADP